MNDTAEFLIIDRILKNYTGPGGAVTVPGGVERIGSYAFSDCPALRELVLPDSVDRIGYGALSGCTALTRLCCRSTLRLEPEMFGDALPPLFREHFMEYLPRMSDRMIRQAAADPALWEQLSAEEQLTLFLTRQNQFLAPVYQERIPAPEPLAQLLLSRLTADAPVRLCNMAASFMELFAAQLPAETLKALAQQLKEAKKSARALEKLEKNVFLMQKLGDAGQTRLLPAEQAVMEHLLADGISDQQLQRQFDALFSKIQLPPLLDREGRKTAPFVLQWLLMVHGTRGGDIALYPQPGLCPAAAELLPLLDPESLQAALRQLGRSHLGHSGVSKKMLLVYPLCRYADEALMLELIQASPRWCSALSGENAAQMRSFRDACVFSEYRCTMLFADRYHDLEHYAQVRGTDEDTIRDRYLSETGLDEAGRKAYDLGSQTVTAELQPDLTFLVRTAAGKLMKSLPKRGADEAKYTAAAADFKEMKQSVKKIVKNRSEALFRDFLSGRSREAAPWKRAYLHNPLLNSVARLVVWQQGEHSFILTDAGAVTADGSAFVIGEEPIGVAHPMELTPEQVAQWQQYFTDRRLRQPFAQIWEPVADLAQVREDRYRGVTFPCFLLKGHEKHGIKVHDPSYDLPEFEFSFRQCSAEVVQHTEQPAPNLYNTPLEITRFGIEGRTRQVNHIVTYLDKITVYSRILKDEVAIEHLLPEFTAAQLTEFIALAAEKQCPNAAALLLHYKNQHFAAFDPMEEFTLD